MGPLKGKLLAGSGGTFRAEGSQQTEGLRPWSGQASWLPWTQQTCSTHFPWASACSHWSPATRQPWQMGSTHTPAGQLSPCLPPSQPSQLRGLLGHLSAQVVIKTQTEYGLPSTEQMKKFPDLEAQKLASTNPEEGRGVTEPFPPSASGGSVPWRGRLGSRC